MTAAARIAQIRARVEAATPGPWHDVEGATPGMYWVELRHRATICDFPYEQGAQEDAAFIAHARADIPALLAAVEAVLALCENAPHPMLQVSGGGVVSAPSTLNASDVRRAITEALT